MKHLTILASIFLAISEPSIAAPNRMPSGKSGPEEIAAVDLTKVDMDAGVLFGEWILWNHNQGGHAVYFVNRRTGLVLYLPWSSNGWVNYRTGDGTWYVLFPTGTPSLQDRRDLDVQKFLGRQPPNVRVAPGIYKFQAWTVTVTAEAMEILTPNVQSTITLRAAAPEFTHNGRTISGVK